MRYTIILLSLLLFVSAPAAVWGITNPGYRGLSVPERPVLEVPTFNRIRINTLNGNLLIQVPLFFVPGKGIPVAFFLTYNSDHRNISSPFGLGWNLSYNIRYTKDAAGNVTIVWGDGRQDTFAFNGATFSAPLGVFMTLTELVPDQLQLTTKHGIIFTFADSSHRKLTSIADPNGNTLTPSYDADGRLTSVTDAGGRTYTLGYNAADKLATLTDPNLGGRAYTFTHDALDRLTQITDPLGNVESYAYDGDNLPTSVTDRRGNPTMVSYTASLALPTTRLPQTVTKSGSVVGFAYDAATKTTAVTDPNGNVTTYMYDVNDRLAMVTNALGNPQTFTWDGNENRLTHTDPNGNTTTATYDAMGNRLTRTDRLGNIETFTYEPALNRIISFQDRKGNQTTFAYDPTGNLTTVTDALTNQTTFAYDAMGQLTTSTNPLGEITQFTYDPNGNVASTTDPLGNTDAATFDGASRPTNLTDANGNSTGFAYDALNRLLATTDALGNPEQDSYDANGNPIQRIDRNGGISTATYNERNQITNATDPLGNALTYAYDLVGNRTSTTDQNGNPTTFSYDALNRMLQKNLPGTPAFPTRSYTYVYDASGNLISRMDPNGQTITFGYDANNRHTLRTLPGEVTAYSYDLNDNLTQATNPTSTLQRTYDALNRVLTITDAVLNKTLTLVYDSAGHKITSNRPDGVQSYTYDAADRLTQTTTEVGTPNAEDFDYTNDSGGRRTRLQRPGNLVTDYAYDSLNRITSLVTSDNGVPIQSFANVYGLIGNIIQETRLDATTSTMTYDARNALTREIRTGAPAYDIITTRDARANILSATGTPFFPTSPLTFTYNAANQIGRETGTGFGGPFTRDYTYDANGNLTQKLGTGASTVDYTYDPLNRTTSATDSGVGAENYRYNALDQLFSIVVPTPAPGEPGTQRFFYDERGNIIASYDENGNFLEGFWHNDNRSPFDNLIGLSAIAPPISLGVLAAGSLESIARFPDAYIRYKKLGSLPRFPLQNTRGDVTGQHNGTTLTEQKYGAGGNIVGFGDVGLYATRGHNLNRNRSNAYLDRLRGGVVDLFNNLGQRNTEEGGSGNPRDTGPGTSYKDLDLLEPFSRGGKVGLFGSAGVGKTVTMKALLNIAEDVAGEALATLVVNKFQGILPRSDPFNSTRVLSSDGIPSILFDAGSSSDHIGGRNRRPTDPFPILTKENACLFAPVGKPLRRLLGSIEGSNIALFIRRKISIDTCP